LIVWLCVQGGASCLSLYRERGQGTKLVLAGYNWRVLILLHNLAFLVSQLGWSGNSLKSTPPCLAYSTDRSPAQGPSGYCLYREPLRPWSVMDWNEYMCIKQGLTWSRSNGHHPAIRLHTEQRSERWTAILPRDRKHSCNKTHSNT
jgi:hypothetical protein